MTLLIEEFQNIGKRLLGEGLVGANFGNMSVREKDGFSITRTGSFLDSPGETIFLPVEGKVPPNASSEYRVHREVYRITPHRAVVHAHPPHAVALSFNRERIIPLDKRGGDVQPCDTGGNRRPGKHGDGAECCVRTLWSQGCHCQGARDLRRRKNLGRGVYHNLNR